MMQLIIFRRSNSLYPISPGHLAMGSVEKVKFTFYILSNFELKGDFSKELLSFTSYIISNFELKGEPIIFFDDDHSERLSNSHGYPQTA